MNWTDEQKSEWPEPRWQDLDPSLWQRMDEADPVLRNALLGAWHTRDWALSEIEHLRAVLAAAVSAGPEPEYQWGVRDRATGRETWGWTEHAARWDAKDRFGVVELIRRTKAGPTEVVDV